MHFLIKIQKAIKMTKHYIKIDIEKVLELVRDAYHMGAVRRVRTKEWFEWCDNEEKKLRAIPFRHGEE